MKVPAITTAAATVTALAAASAVPIAPEIDLSTNPVPDMSTQPPSNSPDLDFYYRQSLEAAKAAAEAGDENAINTGKYIGMTEDEVRANPFMLTEAGAEELKKGGDVSKGEVGEKQEAIRGWREAMQTGEK